MSLVKPIRGIPALLLTLFLIAAGLFVWFRRTGLPWRDGEHRLAGLSAEVSVRWDRWGVPHVVADHELDLARALGWLHANDRMTQMELGRRAASGRLAEVSGEQALAIDRHFRTLRFPETAEAQWQAMGADSRAWVEAYAEGVNAWLEARGASLPPGLRILGQPEPWRATDSLLFALLMADDLSFWDRRPEEERFQWLRAFGAGDLRQLMGDPDVHVPPAIAELAADQGPPTPADGHTAPADDLAAPGSNNWAVAPSRAAGGHALIANDPHLGLFLPSVWYQVLLRSPGYEAAGMTLPGAPGVILGRGRHVAWAFTNVMLDDHDLFFERLDQSGERYWRDGQWRPVLTERQTVKVRGGDEHELVLRRTDIGPLLDADPRRGLPPRSLAWTGHATADPVAAMRRLAAATNPEEALAAVDSYVAPAQNLVAAFDSGKLLYTVLGRVPQRRGGDGRLPSPGWDPAYGWDGLAPRHHHPTVTEPPEDLLVTANSDIFPADFAGPRFAAEFFQPFRAERIRQRLAGRRDWTAEDFAELQMDNRSLFAQRVIAALAAEAPFDGDAQRAWQALEGWDGEMAGRGPAALFAILQRHLFDLFADEQRRAGLEQPLGHRHSLLALLEGTMDPRWFDDVESQAVEDRRAALTGALGRAWRQGAQRWGDRIESWSYAELLTLTLRHRLDAVPVLGPWMRRGPYPVMGSATTVRAFGSRWLENGNQTVTFGPSMRSIVDWSRPDSGWAVLPGGQSGHPSDPHYDDQIASYLVGEMRPAPWSEEAIEAATVQRLALVP